MRKIVYPPPSELLFTLNDVCEYLCKNIYQPPETLLNYAVKKIVILMKAKAGNIRFYDKHTKKLVLKTSYGVSKRYRNAKPFIDVGTSVAGYVFEKGKVYAAEDISKNHLYRFPEYAIKEDVASLLSAPLITKEEKLGVFSIYFSTPRKFKEEEIDFFSILTRFLAGFLTTHRLQYHLRGSYLDVVKALIIALEEKDLATKGHSEKVGKFAIKIAEKLKLPKNTFQILSEFSILHDIGKMIIDSAIINKPGKLTEEEWRAVKQHPVIGAKMISHVNGLASAIPLIKYHHERIDGTGYPKGLCGNDIPLLAKIITAADALEAMTSQRPYKNALTMEQTKDEFIKNRGTQFDEKIADIVIKLIESGEISVTKGEIDEDRNRK